MDTNSCGGLPSGRRERTRDPLTTTTHTNTSALEEWGRDPAQGWCGTLNCRQALLWYSTMSSPARCKWMSPMFHPIFQWEGKGSPYKQEQRSCHWVTQQVNKGGERDEVYLKSIIFLQRKSQAFQELLNDELPVSLSKRNNGVGDEKSRVAWLSKDSLALRGNSGQNLSLFGQTQVKENFLKHGMHGMLKPTVHHPVYLLPKQWWHKLPPTNSSICPASKSTKTNKHTKQ